MVFQSKLEGGEEDEKNCGSAESLGDGWDDGFNGGSVFVGGVGRRGD